MVEVEEIDLPEPVTRRSRFGWLLTTLVRPGKAMREIASADQGVWLLPMLLLTVLVVLSVLVAGPLRKEAILNNPPELPESFQWMSPEQQEQYMQAQASAAGDTQVYIFPMVSALAGLWVRWFLLGAILHLVLTMLGSRSTNTAAYNMAAWSSLPFAIRLIVQIVAMLVTRQLIASPGLSGFIAGDASGAALFARLMLAMVDLYLIWQIILLWIGAAHSGLNKGKALSGTLITILLLLALSALPGFLGAQLGAMNISGPMFFF